MAQAIIHKDFMLMTPKITDKRRPLDGKVDALMPKTLSWYTGPAQLPTATVHTWLAPSIDYSALRNHLTANGFIGGSYAAAVLGLNEHIPQYTAWTHLTGRVNFAKVPSFRMLQGQVLEDGARKLAEMKMRETHPRSEATVMACPVIWQNRERHWQIATLDGLVQRKDGALGLIEIKTTSVFLAKKWRDGIPDMAHLQALHNLAVTGLDVAFVVGWILGSSDFEIYQVEADREVLDELIAGETAFRERYIVGDEHPDVLDTDVDAMSQQFPQDDGNVIELPPEAEEHLKAYQYGADLSKEGDKIKDQAKAQLQLMLGTNTTGLLGDWVVNWKERVRAEHVVKESRYRHFDVRERAPKAPKKKAVARPILDDDCPF